MGKLSQKECVYAAVQAFLQEHDREIELDAGKPIELSKSDRHTVVGMICAARDTMELSAEADAKYDTEQKFKTYTIGLVNNWLRKDTRLNGGSKYQVKNPGSRAGSGDEQLKALRAIRTRAVEANDIKQVDEAIAKRLSEIQVKKQKVEAPIDVNALPENLRHLVIVK